MSDGTKQVLERSERYDRTAARAMRALFDAAAGPETGFRDMRSITIRFEGQPAGGALIILRAREVEGDPVVSFHAGLNADEALMQALLKLHSDDLSWKEDQYG